MKRGDKVNKHLLIGHVHPSMSLLSILYLTKKHPKSHYEGDDERGGSARWDLYESI